MARIFYVPLARCEMDAEWVWAQKVNPGEENSSAAPTRTVLLSTSAMPWCYPWQHQHVVYKYTTAVVSIGTCLWWCEYTSVLLSASTLLNTAMVLSKSTLMCGYLQVLWWGTNTLLCCPWGQYCVVISKYSGVVCEYTAVHYCRSLLYWGVIY